MLKPTDTGDWALNLVTETKGENTYVNKIKPSQGFVESGVLALEPWSRPFLNFQLYVASEWHRWIDSALYPIGNVYTETQNVNPNSTLGMGTWNNIGSQTIGTTTVYYWERTA